MDRDGETALRGRGDTERVRVSLIRRAKVEFGRSGRSSSGITCTVTPGGGPIACTEDAVSWMSALGDCLAGEVTESELFTNGVDMIHELRKLYSLQNCRLFLTPHNQLVLVLVLMQRLLSNSTPAPLMSNPTVTQTISVFDSLKIGPSAQRAWFQRMVSKSNCS